MAHKTLIGGAGYSVSGGRTLIGGAGYTIAKGRTLIGGAGYDLPFKQPTFDEIMADMEIVAAQGRNSSSTGVVNVAVNVTEDSTFYVVLFLNGNVSIAKATVQYVDASTAPIVASEIIAGSTSGGVRPACDGITAASMPRLRAAPSYDGTRDDLVYANGVTIAIVRFPSYVPTQIDAAIQSVTFTRVAGRNSDTNGTVGSTNFTASSRWFVACNTDNGSGAHIAYSSPLGTVIFSTDTTNPSLLWQSGTNMYISQNGTSALSSRGGSIVSVTE